MKRLAELYAALEGTTKTGKKVAALAHYFEKAPPGDAAWGLYFLAGRKLKRLVPSAVLVEATLALSRIPPWLLETCFHEVGDFAETMALLLEGVSQQKEPLPLHGWVEERLLALRDKPREEQLRLLVEWLPELSGDELLVFMKILTGEWRMGASEKLVVRAVAKVAGVPETTIAHRLMGTWEPTAGAFQQLLKGAPVEGELGEGEPANGAAASQPYPFFLATQIEDSPGTLGPRDEWQVEWKWDGIRAQLVHRSGGVWIWSRGEELVTDRFPEVRDQARKLPEGTVLDGEILAWRERPLPFGTLQQRIGRLKLTKKHLEEAPVTFMAYDLLEDGGVDLRERSLSERRARLEALVRDVFPISAIVTGTWEELVKLREQSRERSVEGFMLKRLSSPYRTGRKRGDWWKWKIDPFTVDAVLIHAQPGHGRRATLFTDYTFGVWKDGALVPIAKAYSGLSDAEIDEVDAWVRAHTLEKHGPVRTVEPVHVFEIAFEGIFRSNRHRSGIAVRFPRIARWRRDKRPAEADTLERVEALLRAAR
jgi:DNA ligase-1